MLGGVANEQNLRPGGKSLTGGSAHTPNLTVRLPSETRARLDAIAEQRGHRTSKLVRAIIDEWLAQHDQQSQAQSPPLP